VQLDVNADTPVITPSGKRTTSKQWAADLGLFYTPTLIFYDSHGKEIIRVDSVVGFYRLRRVLDYIISGAYKDGSTLQQYSRKKRGIAP
jgi:thioredoxin-related protein